MKGIGAVLACLLTSCTFLYIPPVLPSQTFEETLDLNGSAGLRTVQDRLELSLTLKTIPKDGWLAVQWFGPTNKPLSSDSQWISKEDVGFSALYTLPGKHPLAAGDWRAVVSFEGKLLRQFSITLIDNLAEP